MFLTFDTSQKAAINGLDYTCNDIIQLTY